MSIMRFEPAPATLLFVTTKNNVV